MARKKKSTRKRTVKKTSSRSTTRKKTAPKCEKPSLLQMLAMGIFAVILLSFILSLILGNSNGDMVFNQPPTMGQDTEIGYTCQRNAECFVVSCEGSENKECVNTGKMERYFEVCGDFNDVEIKSDFAECKCVDGYCV